MARVRSQRQHATTKAEATAIDWASETQRKVFEYGPAPVCASGGYGSSKTWAMAFKALWLSQVYPGNRGVIARRVFEELKHTTMSTFFKVCPPQAYAEGKRSDSEKYLRLSNGSEILWMHLDDPEVTNVIRGLEINWFFLDQAEEIDEQIFDDLSTRLGRWDQTRISPEWRETVVSQCGEWPWKNPAGGDIVPTYSMLACNPDSELHWIWRRFHPDSREHYEPSANRPSYHDMGYKLFTMRSDENKFLPQQNLDAMNRQDESFVRRFVRGEWGIPEGTIHSVNPLSLIEATPELVDKLINSCTLHRTLDHGDSAPTCCLWWAVDGEGNIYCYREYYQPGKLVSDHRIALSKLSYGEEYVFQLADPSIFFRTMQRKGTKWSIADEYSDPPRESAIFWDRGHNEEHGTRNRISEYLRVDPDRRHPITRELGAPRLFFLRRSTEYPNGCYHSVRELRSQRRLRIGSDGGKPQFSDDRDSKIPDHAYDAVRYFVASRPPLAREVKSRRSARSFSAVRRQHIQHKRRRRVVAA